jgi:uncharacterized protein (DUF2225 family)
MNLKLNDKLFFPKEVVCPVCEKSFTRYALKKNQFSISKRDTDYRPIYQGTINPRLFAVCVCPNCFYAGEDKFFCQVMTDDELRRKQFFASHKAQWEAQSRVRAAGSGQQIWKDLAAEKLKEISADELTILRKISPLLKRAAADVHARGIPYNELLRDGDFPAVIRSYELAAICYKARRANHRILGYTYLNGAWASRDTRDLVTDEKLKNDFKQLEMAYLKEAVSFLTITNKATGIDDAFMPDGTPIIKENMPQSRIFEVMFILAGAHRLLGNIAESDKFLEQIIFGSANAQGIMLWFVQQARDMKFSSKTSSESVPPVEDGDDDDDEESEG